MPWAGAGKTVGPRVFPLPVSDAWAGEKLLANSKDWGMGVILRAYVSGRRPNGYGRLRPHSFYLHVSMRSKTHRVDAGSGKCGSLREVERFVTDFDFSEQVLEVQKKYYSRSEASCLYRKDESGAWIPLCTTFDAWGLMDELPHGDYLEVSLSETGKLCYVSYRNGYQCKSSGGLSDGETPENVMGWIQ